MRIHYTSKYLLLRFVGEGNSAIDVPLYDLIFVKEEGRSDFYYGLFKLETGIALEIPMGYNGLLKFRSGCGKRLRTAFCDYSCEPGYIDATFRGEMAFYVTIVSTTSFANKSSWDKVREVLGDYPLQLMIHKVESPEFNIVEKLSSTWRGEGGFGSTGDGIRIIPVE
jgi:dUTPase